MRRRDHAYRTCELSHLLVFSSSLIRLDEVPDLVFSVLILVKSILRDPGFYLHVFSSWWSRLDDIQYLVFSSIHPHEFDLTRSVILSSCLLVIIKSTWRDQGSCLLVQIRLIDLIQYLVFLSLLPREVEMTRYRLLSSRLLILIKSTWQYPRACLMSSPPEEADLTRSRILTFCLLASSSCLLDSFSRLHISSSGGTFKLPYLWERRRSLFVYIQVGWHHLVIRRTLSWTLNKLIQNSLSLGIGSCETRCNSPYSS